MNTRVLLAVFKRNFIGYFANPTGYVFICVFVLLSSNAAFLPYEFFSANLANLAQLNLWFPLIMLVFIPAITMGIWADERRQGTDELLLTIPAGDFEIVCGKYCSAVAIYTVSLLFSLGCNLVILSYLGNPDQGLFFSTYLGYGFMGITMIAIGMVASFLTGNLTVAYILGAIFCVPLVALNWVDAAPLSQDAVALLQKFSMSNQFETFGRGIFSLASTIYFLGIIVAMLYLCMVLIGRRHWSANQQWVGAFHFSIRAIALVVIALALCLILERFDVRADLTAEKLSTLSPLTADLIQAVDPQHPVVIEAYLSPEVPEPYIQTRMNIISVLKEFESRSKGRIMVRIHEIQPFTKEALIASERYDIQPREVWFISQGNRKKANIFLGITFRCGLRTLTLPFVDRGLSPEYELVHALCAVTDPQKRRIGVLKTDVPLFGQFSMQNFSMSPDMRIVEELKKRYTVVEVDPAQPITERFDALIVVQPSSLGPPEMVNLVDTIRRGQPTVLFEDAFPFYMPVAGTAEPRRQQNQMMMMQRQVPPKGDIGMLWNLLGIEYDSSNSVWQDYNPIRKLQALPKGVVFLDKATDPISHQTVSPFADDPITRKLQYLMIPFPGSVKKSSQSTLQYEPLIWTIYRPSGVASVTQSRDSVQTETFESLNIKLDRVNRTTEGPKELAVHITGEVKLPEKPQDLEKALDLGDGLDADSVADSNTGSETERGQQANSPKTAQLDVVLIADIDMLHNEIFQMQETGSPPGMGINLDFENVSLLLNAIDVVAGDDRFVDIRTRRPIHRTLQRIDKATDEMRQRTAENRERYERELTERVQEDIKKLSDRLEQINLDFEKQGMSQEEVDSRVRAVALSAEKSMKANLDSLRRDVSRKIELAEIRLNEYIRTIQGQYKFYAIVLPPIPPLAIGLIVLFTRRIREYEGVPKARRKR